MTEPELLQMARPDFPLSVGLVIALPAKTVIGSAESVQIEDDTSELGIAIDDAWQSMGMGTELARALIAEARRVGTKKLLATCLVQNSRMRTLARKLGFSAISNPEDPRLVSLQLKL